MTQQQEHLLFFEEDTQDSSPVLSSVNASQRFAIWATWRNQVIAHSTLIALYTIVSIVVIHAHSNGYSNESFPPMPAINSLHIQYTGSIFHNLSSSPYAGQPSPEIDAAWSELLVPMHIRITESELQRSNQRSVALPEGGGHLGWLGVFHELHCIVCLNEDLRIWHEGALMLIDDLQQTLRQWYYKEYYHGDANAAEMEHIGPHIDHCFELLRQSAVCHADASLTTFIWHPAEERPMFNATESFHTCVDWSALIDSLADRVVPAEELLRLNNPLMHKSRIMQI